jgi:hypothetical protein
MGGQASWDKADITAIDNALSAAMSDARLNNVMAQYFPNTGVTSDFHASTVLAGPKPPRMSQGDVEAVLRGLFTDGKLAGFDYGSTIFNFLLPGGSILNTNAAPTAAPAAAAKINSVHPEDAESSLEGLGGYHGSVHTKETHGKRTTLYYAMGVYSETRPDGSQNGIVAFNKPWKNVVATLYHELQEFRTDPDVQDAINAGDTRQGATLLGWVSQQGEECGDYPIFESQSLGGVFKQIRLAQGGHTVPIQLMYSNARHGPQGPAAQPVH